jgi:hypothetical protein
MAKAVRSASKAERIIFFLARRYGRLLRRHHFVKLDI